MVHEERKRALVSYQWSCGVGRVVVLDSSASNQKARFLQRAKGLISSYYYDNYEDKKGNSSEIVERRIALIFRVG